jgi:hypothetical protein
MKRLLQVVAWVAFGAVLILVMANIFGFLRIVREDQNALRENQNDLRNKQNAMREDQQNLRDQHDALLANQNQLLNHQKSLRDSLRLETRGFTAPASEGATNPQDVDWSS